jgi:hypothetical protein
MDLQQLESSLDQRLAERTNLIRDGILKRDAEIASLRTRCGKEVLLRQRAERVVHERKQSSKRAVEQANRVVDDCRAKMQEMNERLSAALHRLSETAAANAALSERAAAELAETGARAREAKRARHMNGWLCAQVDALDAVVRQVEGRAWRPSSVQARRKFRAAVWAVIFCRASRPGSGQVWSDAAAARSVRLGQGRAQRAMQATQETQAAADVLPRVVQRRVCELAGGGGSLGGLATDLGAMNHRLNEAETAVEHAAMVVKHLEARLVQQVDQVEWIAQGLEKAM